MTTPEPRVNGLAGQTIWRMNGAGNKILVLDLRQSAVQATADDARALHAAPGLDFDQLMALYPAARADAAAAIKIFNNDGSISGACGNGTRCVGWLLMRDLPDGAQVSLDSDAGPLGVARVGALSYRVDMGSPRYGWRDIPLGGAGQDTVRVALNPPVAGAPDSFSAVSMGNPHAIFFVADAGAIDLAALGPRIEHHALFPERVNASFAQMLARDDIRLRVWERGAGATLACGTAACAALVAGVRAGLAERSARVRLPGGDLFIEWRASDDHVLMTGPVELEREIVLGAEIFKSA
jgi:diaminopimelate epimerase